MSTQLQTTTTSTSSLSSSQNASQYLDQALAVETLKMMDQTLHAPKWSTAVIGTILFIVVHIMTFFNCVH